MEPLPALPATRSSQTGDATARAEVASTCPPPWHGIPPELPVYRARGHRRLSAKAYETTCANCIWGCRIAVEMIVDQWNPGKVQNREETSCYGPLSCAVYKPGPTHKVPGRRGMSYEEKDWVDRDAVSHRGPDD